MDIKKILSQIDSISEGSMKSAEKHSTGPKFVGKWKGTDSATKARSRYVGAAESKNLLQDLESKLNETPVRDIMQEFTEFKALNEFAPDDSGSPKYIPWNDFIEGVKGIVGKEFATTEKVVKSTIQDRFTPHDPMEFGPTMLYSYYEARAGRNKGAISTRGAIQIGKYIPNSSNLGKQNFITSFNILKGHPFERHFDLTPENISKIANIILGNTEGAYKMQPVAEDTGSQVFQSMGSQLIAIGNDADKLKHEGADQLKQEIVNKLDEIGDARLSQATKTFLQRVVEFNRNNPKTMAAVFGFTFAIVARVSMQVSHNLGLSPTQATLILEATLPTLGNFLGYLVNGFSVKDSIQSGLIAGGIGVAGTMAASRALGEEIESDVTEDLDEVAMNPTAFAQAIKTGQDKGVLVGFEFETCIPQSSVQQWKTGDVPPETPRYDPESTAWVEGKTVADLVAGIASKANGQLGNVMDDLFKNKGSVATQLGYKSPWDGYRRWVGEQLRERMADTTNTALVFDKLGELLKDPEVAAMPVEYSYSSETGDYGPSSNWNGRTFTIEIIKRQTGVDFGKRVPKSQLTAELAEKVQAACRKAYQITRGPYDSRVHAVANALANRRSEIEADYYLRGHGNDMDADRIAAVKQHFMDWAQQTLGTTELKEILLKKWAFKGRVSNATPVLKEKLWYYVTAGAEPPASLRQRNYGRTSYRDGADFLKANLKDVYGDNMEIFTGYHQATKKLDRWYIEPDGSLRPDGDDYSAEVVSPPLPAEKAMAALKTWYQKAKQLKLYTNGSTGLHINVSIPGNLDVLKLAVFAGDQYVLKKFGRENNSYARSVIKNLKGRGDLPKLGSKEFSAAEKEMKQLVKSISGDHFATVNFNGKYVSFRHAGGDYLNKMDDIVNTVGRFVRAMVIAADPTAYRDEYVGKLVKLMKPEAGDAGSEKLPLSDIRAVATKGIPVQMYDVVYRPIDVNAENPEPNVAGGQEGIRRKMRDSFHSDTPYQIIPDPSVRDRLLNDTSGLATPSKEWIQSAPDSAFVRVVMYPRNRAELDSFADRLASDAGARTQAFGMYDNNSNKSAVGSRYTRALKQNDPGFKDAVTALRGGAVKPAPLPGSKAAPAAQPATFRSQEPDNTGDWGLWANVPHRFARTSNAPDAPLRRFRSEQQGREWLASRRGLNPANFDIMEIPADYESNAAEWAAAGGVRAPEPESEGTPQWMLWNLADDQEFRISGGGAGGRGVYFNGTRDQAIDQAREFVASRGVDPNSVELRPNPAYQQSQGNARSQGNWGIWLHNDERFARRPNTIISDNDFRRFDSREAAERYLELTRAENPRMRTDLEVREIEPTQSNNQEQGPGTWTITNGSITRYFDTTQVNSERAFQIAQQMHDEVGGTVTIERDGVTYGTVPRQQSERRVYSFRNPVNNNVADTRIFPGDDEAMEYGQRLANRFNTAFDVVVAGVTVDTVDPQGIQTYTDNNEDQTYRLVSSEDGSVIQTYFGSLRDTFAVAQSIANRRGYDVNIYDGQGAVVDTARTQELDEVRIFHPKQKVNVIYNPMNSMKRIIVAKAVDHALANRVINSYVARSQNDPQKKPINANDFVLQPVKHEYTTESFDSKQAVINHFVKQGKTAAQGAAAWERGYRGTQPKSTSMNNFKFKKPPVKNWQDLDEYGGVGGYGAASQAPAGTTGSQDDPVKKQQALDQVQIQKNTNTITPALNAVGASQQVNKTKLTDIMGKLDQTPNQALPASDLKQLEPLAVAASKALQNPQTAAQLKQVITKADQVDQAKDRQVQQAQQSAGTNAPADQQQPQSTTPPGTKPVGATK